MTTDLKTIRERLKFTNGNDTHWAFTDPEAITPFGPILVLRQWAENQDTARTMAALRQADYLIGHVHGQLVGRDELARQIRTCDAQRKALITEPNGK